ncbi:MAG: RNA polymerase sigma factor [Lachnospiraceae bacterium]|nr:RNA polymerase sigma factor [Lachnospiraceae bacterium]
MAKDVDHKYIATLVLRAQAQNSDAFAELYGMTYNKVYNYACHYLKDIHLAQDAVQEVYITALKNINKLKDPLLFVAWLNQISFHTCYDICEKKNKKYGVVDDEILESICDDHISSNPERQTLDRDENRRLQEAINRLPVNEKEVIIMKFFNNMKLDEIANATDVSKSTVKRYLASAMERLQQSMKD